MKCNRLLLSVLFTCVFAFNTHNAWAATSIVGCTRLTHSGPYVLKNNITATAATMTSTWIAGYTGCIVIAADNVTIDLAGYVVTGPGGFTVAIAQDTGTRKGDVVHSGSVTNFSDGIGFAGVGHTIQGINASNNGDAGIYVFDQGNRIIGNTVNKNGGYGFYINVCPNLLLENMARGNGSVDIAEPAGCTDTRQENVPAP